MMRQTRSQPDDQPAIRLGGRGQEAPVLTGQPHSHPHQCTRWRSSASFAAWINLTGRSARLIEFGRASLVAVQNPCVVVVGQPCIEIQAEPTVCWAVRVADKTPARLITARLPADRRWHRFDQDMVRADVYVLGASEPAAREIAGLLSGAGPGEGRTQLVAWIVEEGLAPRIT
jgi:hypothetical protein